MNCCARELSLMLNVNTISDREFQKIRLVQLLGIMRVCRITRRSHEIKKDMAERIVHVLDRTLAGPAGLSKLEKRMLVSEEAVNDMLVVAGIPILVGSLRT